MNKKYFKGFLWITIILSIVITTVLYLFKFGSFTFSQDKGDWGTFGDYIGGILGTSLTAITIYLLFETYMTQNAQLEIQAKDSINRFIDLQYEQIIKDIENISFKKNKGSDALYAWDSSHIITPNNVFNTLNFVLQTFKSHIETINSEKKIDKRMKEHFFNRAYLMFHSKIIWPTLDKIYNEEAFKNHTDNLYHNFNNLIMETYKYLTPRGKLAIPTDQRILVLIPEFQS